MWIHLLSYCCVFLAALGQLLDEIPTVTIAQGTVIGSVANDGEYFEFYGIPYADSTSGSHRFKAPMPPPAFTDAFVADRKDIKCVRALGVGYEGTEDCLIVNVFTPSLNETSNLPVMVVIKGREFEQEEEPELSFSTLVDQDVIVVSINFRESILGFLCLGTETAPGNAGLKDIIAGLKWVQENISQFGGDPNSVTILGHGSGAAAVDLVTLSPMSDGLIHRAIAQSGSSITPWAVTRDPTKYAILVAEALGHTVADSETLSDAFTRISVSALMAVINELDLTDISLAFSPCLENENLVDEKFLIKSPYSTIVDGDYRSIPFILGFVENEGTIKANEAIEDGWLDRMDEEFEKFIQPDLEFGTDHEAQNTVNDIRNFYFGDRPIYMGNIADYILYHGDTMITISAIREAKLRATTSSDLVYLYQFSYQGSLGEPFVGPFSVVGASHSEELAYLFNPIESDIQPNELDIQVKSILVERWTNFAKTGFPTSTISSIEWEPVTSENNNILIIRNYEDQSAEESPNVEVILVNPRQEAITFWEDIYSEHFLDASNQWNQDIREDEDSDESIIEGSGTETPPGSEEEYPEEDGEEEDDTDSASTAVGYTFLIISLFTVLNQIHLSQMLSL